VDNLGHKWNRQIDDQSDWRFAFSSLKLDIMLWYRSIHRRLDRQTKKLPPSTKPLKSLTILRLSNARINRDSKRTLCKFSAGGRYLYLALLYVCLSIRRIDRE